MTATVFVTGQFALHYPELIQEAAHRGYDLGTHGWRHGVDPTENFRTAPYDTQRRWIELSTEAVERVAGVRPTAFRAPNLWVSESTLRALEDCGYRYDSSVPARRFDFGIGQVSSPRYFRAPVVAYHPARGDLACQGDSPVVEVPPSAFFLPANMSSLRVLGLGAVRWMMRRVRAATPLLVSYVHPVEFELAANLEMPEGVPRRYRSGLGPKNLVLLEALIDYANELGYQSATISEAASTVCTGRASK
jgi:peptidoglycan-N-acetylglucosamine deacetylase